MSHGIRSSHCLSIPCPMIITGIYKNKTKQDKPLKNNMSHITAVLNCQVFSVTKEWCWFTPMEIPALICHFLPSSMSIMIKILANDNMPYAVFLFSLFCSVYYTRVIFLFSPHISFFSFSFFCVFSLETLLLFVLAKEQVPFLLFFFFF